MRSIQNFLDIKGVLLIIVYLLILSTIIIYLSNKYSEDKLVKKIFIRGYFYKILMGLGFAIIYDFYYNWEGDTYFYYNNACRLGEVLFSNPKAYFMMFFDLIDKTNISQLPQAIEYYPNFRDPSIYAVHRFLSPFTIIGFKNYYLIIICLNTFLFILNWKFFRFLSELFPAKTKIIALSVLFIPSVTFWGSGIIKDPFTLSFTFIIIIYFYKIFFKRKISIKNIFLLLIAAYVVIELKPYILYAIVGSCLVWLGFTYLYKIKNRFIRIFVFPVVMLLVAFVGIYVITRIGSNIGGAYKDLDSMLGKAVDAQQDLKRDYYDGAAFDIGDFEPTIQGALSVMPAAIVAGLYRPFIWEARSIVMMLSGIENMILLLLSLYVIFKVGLKLFFKNIIHNPFLIFCILFSIVMAFSIGLSTSNFGALVRFKVPFLPFFFMFWLFIIDDYRTQKKQKAEQIKNELSGS